MSASDDHVPAKELMIGLDRAAIHQNGMIQVPHENLGNKAIKPHDHADDRTENETHHPQSHPDTVDSIKKKAHQAAVKIRKTFHISKASDYVQAEGRTVLAEHVDEQPASRLEHQLPEPEKHSLENAVHHPVETVKSKLSGQGNRQLAANAVAKEVPHGKEVDLVNAYSAVNRATTDKEKFAANDDMSVLLRERQSTYVRWTLDRHVTKVKVLPRDTAVKPERADFEKASADHGVTIDWKAFVHHLLLYYAQLYGGQYIGYGSDPPTPSKETIIPNVERLLIASSPLQMFIMTSRRVYRWERPAETTKYLLVYFFLWYFNLLLPGMISGILYLVVERRVHGNTLDDLRDAVVHREDTQKTALFLTEFIDKKGDEKWMEDLLEGAGPWLMVQLADMANFFESARNFYEWQVPHRTLRTLATLAVAVPITALVPVWVLIKCMTLAAGITFFGLFPIATNFPDYRLLVSPSKRLLWNIPTHAEWAIKYMQAEGRSVKGHNSTPQADRKASSTGEEEPEYGSYVADEHKTTGRVVIRISSVRFVSKTGDAVHWALPYDEIGSLEKQNRVVSNEVLSKLQTESGRDLRIVTKMGKERVLKNVDKRDEVFSQMVGFSETNWQVVW